MACTRVIQSGVPAMCTAITPDGQQIAVGLWGVWVGVLLLDARFGETKLAGRGFVNCISFSPTSASQPLLLAVGYADKIVWVWDCSSGTRVAELQGHSDEVKCVAFSPDGRLLASASYDNTVRLWRTDDWHAPPDVLSGHAHSLYGASFSCDGRLLASCSHDGKVKLWHFLDSGAAAALPAADAAADAAAGLPVLYATFSPVDSRLLAYGGWGNTPVCVVRVDADNGTIAVERKLQGHTEAVWSLAFSPCGQKLASASHDETVRLWSVASGACLRVLRGHTKFVNAVAFFPNGKQLISGSNDTTVRIWTLCAWSDKTHQLFGAPLKAAVFTLMCVRARLGDGRRRSGRRTLQLPRLPMEVWLLVFEQLQLALEVQKYVCEVRDWVRA